MENDSDFNCLIVVFLSHGNKNKQILANDGPMEIGT